MAVVDSTSSAAIAEFFAKKKRKKPFKFNANLVDVNSIASTTHVDAPALSTEEPKAATVDASTSETTPSAAPTPDWDEAAAPRTKATAPKTNMEQTTLEIKSTGIGGAGSDNIAERMRIEETRAQLAAARQGMERQAAAAEEKKRAAAAVAQEKAAAVAASGRWVAPHMRNMPSRLPGAATKLDTASEESFPDLAAAGKILQQQQAAQVTVRVPKKTPVGGGATWASKPAVSPKKAAAPTPAKKPEPAAKKEPEPAPKTQEAPAPAPAPAAATPLPVVPPKIKKKTTTKKKKKDLSTFKPGGAS